ncbi:MAG: hypothetical protein ACOC44_00845 [Promethearchaeia archaeon]
MNDNQVHHTFLNRSDYGGGVWRGCKTDVRSAIFDELRSQALLGRGSSKYKNNRIKTKIINTIRCLENE